MIYKPGDLDRYVTAIITPAEARAYADEWYERSDAVQIATLSYQAAKHDLVGLDLDEYDSRVMAFLREAGVVAALLMNVPVRVRLPDEGRIMSGDRPEFEFFDPT